MINSNDSIIALADGETVIGVTIFGYNRWGFPAGVTMDYALEFYQHHVDELTNRMPDWRTQQSRFITDNASKEDLEEEAAENFNNVVLAQRANLRS